MGYAAVRWPLKHRRAPGALEPASQGRRGTARPPSFGGAACSSRWAACGRLGVFIPPPPPRAVPALLLRHPAAPPPLRPDRPPRAGERIRRNRLAPVFG